MPTLKKKGKTTSVSRAVTELQLIHVKATAVGTANVKGARLICFRKVI
jgi:hypothetical protein